MAETNDHELLVAWRDGDRRAGSRLIARYVRPLHRFFINKVRREQDVEELAQRTFTALVESVDRFRGEASLRTWVYAIARNVLREWARERSKRERVDFGTVSVEELGIGAGTAIDGRREHQRMLEALRRLPLETQVLLELYFLQQLTAREIANIDGIPEGTVRNRIRLARRDLGRIIDELRGETDLISSTPEALDDWARSIREAWSGPTTRGTAP